MGISFNWRPSKHNIKAIIVYPNRQIQIKKVRVDKDRFTHMDRTFIIDEKSVYFLKKEPVSFYHLKNSSPKMINSEGVVDSMKSNEVSSVMESKIVEDIITAGTGKNNWVLIAAAAAAVISLIILLNDMGLLKLSQGG